MAASTENENEEKYVISRIDYDDEFGYYPTSLIRVSGGHCESAVNFKGTLKKAVELAESKLGYQKEELAVFCWDDENDRWEMKVIVGSWR